MKNVEMNEISRITEEKTKIGNGKLTIEELRRCRGFEEISQSDANEIIESLFQLAVIVYNLNS